MHPRIINIRFFFILILIGFIYPQDTFSQNPKIEFELVKPHSIKQLNYSGDNQFQTVNNALPKPIRVQVLDSNSKGVPGVQINFELISSPEKSNGFKIDPSWALTDSNGIVSTYVTFGSGSGNYFVSAKSKTNGGNLLIYELNARDSKWIFILFAGLVGGLSLFLFGMFMMSDGLQNAAGNKMRAILTSITNNRFVALSIGALITMIIQSSSATTVMLVGFVQSGLMSFAQSLGIILGADIGTTITAQIIAFKLTDYALWFIAIGFFINLFFKSSKLKQIGKSILGFGLLFFGIYIMSEAMTPLRTYEPFIEILLKLENPFLGILIGAILTALFQSSSAFVGLIIVISTQGLISLEAAIALLLGANLGTAVTAILASLNTGREAKKVALAHTLFKVFGIFVFIWWIPTFAELIQNISPKGDSGMDQIDYMSQVVPRQIANAHTLFNVALAVLFIPFTGQFTKLIDWILPEKEIPPDEKLEVKYLDEKLLSSPALALSLAKQETIRMGHLVQDMTNDILLPFFLKDSAVLKEIVKKENLVNYLRDEVNSYLRKVIREDVSENRVNEAFQIMYTVKEFEQIADVISKNLIEKANKWIDSKQDFTQQGKKEIIEYQQKTQKQLARAILVFRTVNLEMALEMKAKNKKYKQMAIDLERQHYLRIQEEIKQSIETSEFHLELITNFRIITSHATNIARILLKWQLNTE